MNSNTHVINDPTSSEQITLEEEAAQIENTEEQVERPEWLPDKFKSPEELAKAYNNLETRLGSSSGEQEQEEGGEDLPPTDVADKDSSEATQQTAILTASEEFASSGELSNETYKSLEEVGLPKDLVDSYIAGQQALQKSGEAALLNSVGGREAYDTMADWASENLSDTQLEAYNQALETGTDEQAALAIDWLKSKYDAANGTSPVLTQGKTTGSGFSAFESRAQVMAAMSERDATGRKRYEVDPAYRAEIERRLSISNI